MTKSQAIKRAKQLFGDNYHIRDYGIKSATTPEQREAARREMEKIRNEKPDGWKNRERELFSIIVRQRYAVGRIILGGFAFGIDGSGDTWEEAFAAAKKRISA